MIHAESVKAWEAETEYFRSIIASKEAKIVRLRAVLEMAQPEIDRLEYTESCSDDGYGRRLKGLREIKNAIKQALAGQEGK